MDTLFAPTARSTESPAWRRWFTTGILALILVAALVAAYVAEASMSTEDATGNGGLSSQQIVTRGEVADRYQASGNAELSSQQIVTRGEVADRYAK